MKTPCPPAQGKELKYKPSPIDRIRSRGWCFTLNNYTDDEIAIAKAIECDYIVFGREVGEEEKTPHLQGFIHWANARTGISCRKIFANRAHWAKQMGSFAEASSYCKKGNQPKAEWEELRSQGPNYGRNKDVFEKGVDCEQGKRTDLEEAIKMIQEGAPMSAIAEYAPSTFVKCQKGLVALKAALIKDRDPNDPPIVVWRWGLAGVGKTRGPLEAHKSYYIKDGTSWWDGYEQQEAIIIDDFDGKWPYRDLLRVLDRNPYQGQFKGGYVKINSKYIYITCEHPPEFFWGPSAMMPRPDGSPHAQNELDQILRRITRIEHINANPNIPLRLPERVEINS